MKPSVSGVKQMVSEAVVKPVGDELKADADIISEAIFPSQSSNLTPAQQQKKQQENVDKKQDQVKLQNIRQFFQGLQEEEQKLKQQKTVEEQKKQEEEEKEEDKKQVKQFQIMQEQQKEQDLAVSQKQRRVEIKKGGG